MTIIISPISHVLLQCEFAIPPLKRWNLFSLPWICDSFDQLAKGRCQKQPPKICSIGSGTRWKAENGNVASRLLAKARRAMRKLLSEAGERVTHVI